MNIMTKQLRDPGARDPAEVTDTLMIGAGLAGLYMMRHLRELGLSTRVIEAGTDVGGTWYWNRYPGARTDSESWYYCFSNDSELLNDWDWEERYPGQPEMLRYLQHYSERYDLRRDIQFSTFMKAARYVAEDNLWEVETAEGERFRARYLITAIGILSSPYLPPFKGIESYKGEWHVTGRWPKDEPDFRGKRVAIIGTGASGIQAIPLIAETAGHLTVFQRTPNYVIPGRNHNLSDAERDAIKADYAAIWTKAKGHAFGMPFDVANRRAVETEEAEIERVLEEGWQKGGFRYLFETFDDLLNDIDANFYASEFIRRKIRETVKDPVTAEKLCPKNHPFATKRPPAGHGYYETFNRDNVTLVDLTEDAIEEITETGIRLTSGNQEFDMIIFATGFDGGVGAFGDVDITGRDGLTLREKFSNGPVNYLSLTCHGFPNMFTLAGPLCPFANMPPIIEATGDNLREILVKMKEDGLSRIEVQPEAEVRWVQDVIDAADKTLVNHGSAANSWLTGANIPGKRQMPMVFMGGIANYRDRWSAEREAGYPSFVME